MRWVGGPQLFFWKQPFYVAEMSVNKAPQWKKNAEDEMISTTVTNLGTRTLKEKMAKPEIEKSNIGCLITLISSVEDFNLKTSLCNQDRHG